MFENFKIKRIAKKNLLLMLSSKEGGMQDLLSRESIGGNAGILDDKRPCAGTNFYFDIGTGEIKYFGNFQYVPSKIREKYVGGTFKVALGIGVKKKKPTSEIIQTLFPRKTSKIAKKAIKLSAQLYNHYYEKKKKRYFQ